MTTTIFTPTYNRAYILPKLFESLCSQTSSDFEWLVIDDGSTDNTEKLFEDFKNHPHNFQITYVKQENGGKHRAINRGVKIANGELFFIVDSDDFLREDAVELIAKYWNKKEKECLGLCFRRISYDTGVVFGEPFPKYEFYASSIDLHFKYKITADKAEIFRTDILRKFPFPEIDGEKFCPETVCWFAMAKHKPNLLYCIDEAIYCSKYLEDGLTEHYDKLKSENPKAYKKIYWIELSLLDVLMRPSQLKRVVKELLKLYFPFLSKIKYSLSKKYEIK